MFKSPLNNGREVVYNKDGYKFRLRRCGIGIYLIREDGTKLPVCDWSDIKVFVDSAWLEARDYQVEAFLKFVYNEECARSYFRSPGSSNLPTLSGGHQYQELQTRGLSPNIVFSMFRSDNGDSVFMQKQDMYGLLNGAVYQMVIDVAHAAPMRVVEESSRAVPSSSPAAPSSDMPSALSLQRKAVPSSSSFDVAGLPCQERLPSRRIGSWFNQAFGFEEFEERGDYHAAKAKLEDLFRAGGCTSINGICSGEFAMVDIIQLSRDLPDCQSAGNVRIKNIIADIRTVHLSQANNLCTIQVASQLNCLEMVSPTFSPEHGITCYQDDHTQGPICAMAAPAALAYRNYLHDGGQTATHQLDMAKDLLEYFRSFDELISWDIVNGYLMIRDIEVLNRITGILSNPKLKQGAKEQIKAGVHRGVGIFANGIGHTHVVNQVFCSGLPISYHDGALRNQDLWDGLSEVVLEAYYEITLLTACSINRQTATHMPCYLTQVGGGAFGMKRALIVSAIERACNMVKTKGYDLDVQIVHYGRIDTAYTFLDSQ